MYNLPSEFLVKSESSFVTFCPVAYKIDNSTSTRLHEHQFIADTATAIGQYLETVVWAAI
jgi:hypothetical protein